MEPRFEERVQRKKLFQTPRYTFKTSIVEADICRSILKWPDIAMGVFRANRELAAQITRNVEDASDDQPRDPRPLGRYSEGLQ